MMWGAHEGMGWWMAFGGIFWVLFLGAIVYLVASVVSRDSRPREPHAENPLDIAKRRYASGEISAEEFERIKRDLLS